MSALHVAAIAVITIGPGAAVSALMVLIGNWTVRRRERRGAGIIPSPPICPECQADHDLTECRRDAADCDCCAAIEAIA